MAKRKGDYQSEFRSEFHCYCCRRPINEPDDFGPVVCGECWANFTSAEKAARWEAARSIRLQQEILIALDHQTGDAIEVAQAAKAIENLTKALRPQADGFADLVDKIKGFVLELMKRLDEDEEFREKWRKGGGGRGGDLN